jgi:hypothetical protein
LLSSWQTDRRIKMGSGCVLYFSSCHCSAFTKPLSTPMPINNITPVLGKHIEDDTRKRKSLSTPTQPTNLPNDICTPLNPPFSRPKVTNPHLKPAHPNVFTAASTPQSKLPVLYLSLRAALQRRNRPQMCLFYETCVKERRH